MRQKKEFVNAKAEKMREKRRKEKEKRERKAEYLKNLREQRKRESKNESGSSTSCVDKFQESRKVLKPDLKLLDNPDRELDCQPTSTNPTNSIQFPKSVNERVKTFREKVKQNPELFLKYKEKERLSNERRRLSGKLKKISQMNESQKLEVRKKNREYKRKERMKKNPAQETDSKLKIKKRKSGNSKLLSQLKKKLENQKKITNKWKKKFYKVNKKNVSQEEKNVEKILKGGKAAIKKRLLFCEALSSQLQHRKSQLKSERDKSLLGQLVAGKVLKKYRVMRQASNFASMYTQRKNLKPSKIRLKRRNKLKEAARLTMQNSVEEFLTKDENSIPAPGAKQTIQKNGKTMRIRFLSDTLDNLYESYKNESNIKISRASFYRLKPFWIVKPKPLCHDTCQCEAHSNFEFLLQALFNLKLILSKSIKNFTQSMTCSIENKDCMYRICEKCANKVITEPENKSESCNYYQWKKITEKQVGAKGLTYDVKKTKRIKIVSTIADIIKEVNSRMKLFFQHVYDTAHQYRTLRIIRESLKLDEVYVVIDFSENFEKKYAKQVQAAHFGASKEQIALHTGTFFYRNRETEAIECVSFGTVSDECLRHDCSAIWAHMKPVLDLMKSHVPDLHTVHFQSDGPSAQYKNKSNFYLMTYYFQQMGLCQATWNFTTAGHGKSFADGIGGSIKNQCNRAVTYGKDVISAQSMIEIVTSSEDAKVRMFSISRKEIEEIDLLIPENLKPVPHTRSIYQILWKKENLNTIYLNSLSCANCTTDPPCKHFSLQNNNFTFQSENSNSSENSSNVLNESSDAQSQNSQFSQLANGIQNSDWIAVLVNDTWVPGIVQKVSKEQFLVNCMNRIGKKLKWPKSSKTLWIDKTNFISKIDPPLPDLSSKVKNTFVLNDEQHKNITARCRILHRDKKVLD